MEYMSVSEAAAKWEIPERVVQKYCRVGIIPNAWQEFKGSPWYIPVDAVPPSRTKKTNRPPVIESSIDTANIRLTIYQELEREHQKIKSEVKSLVSKRNKNNETKIQPQISERRARQKWIESILKKYKLGGQETC